MFTSVDLYFISAGQNIYFCDNRKRQYNLAASYVLDGRFCYPRKSTYEFPNLLDVVTGYYPSPTPQAEEH
jgi:hypothetical protein